MKIGTKVKIAVGKARGVGSIAGKDEDVLGTFYKIRVTSASNAMTGYMNKQQEVWVCRAEIIGLIGA